MSAGEFAPIVPKLVKLLPLFASDKDGEVVATARAIGRTLEAAGADFHDLAALISPESTPQPSGRQEDDDGHRMSAEEWSGAIVAILDTPPYLYPGEKKFLRDMLRMTHRGRKPSAKQAAWLRKIARRA
jgi:hypothetical protein